jgi:hypothetical protein
VTGAEAPNSILIDDATPGASLVEDGARMTASNLADAIAIGPGATSYAV